MDGKINKKVAMVSLGCAKNLVNSEQMMFMLREAGYDVTGETEGADVVVVNTCGFLESAVQEAIDTILGIISSSRERAHAQKIVVAGCLAERYKGEVRKEIPEIDAVVGTGSYGEITSVVRMVLESDDKPAVFGDLNAPASETGRVITTSEAWAYLKIAEGCDNGCGYCLIPSIRGRYRSRPQENIISEASDLAKRGIKELIVVAQDVTRYGLDLYGERKLKDLLTKMCGIDGLRWIRLHYLYPDMIDDELIDVVAKNDKIVKYLDIPIQHINDGILQSMRRRGAGGEIRALLRRIRQRIPGVVLRTSVIAGLPGEGESEFEELCDFLWEAKIERAGIFPYSPEEGTPAALMERPEIDITMRRVELLCDIQSRIMDDFNLKRIGSVTTVVVEGYDDSGHAYGRSYAESPDVDGYINIANGDLSPGEFIDIHIKGAKDGELYGEALRQAPSAEISTK